MVQEEDLTQPKAIRLAILAIIVEAQEFGECPWCECAIGATTHHWVSTCPFYNMNDLMDKIHDAMLGAEAK
jgi:hypothetical protein